MIAMKLSEAWGMRAADRRVSRAMSLLLLCGLLVSAMYVVGFLLALATYMGVWAGAVVVIGVGFASLKIFRWILIKFDAWDMGDSAGAALSESDEHADR